MSTNVQTKALVLTSPPCADWDDIDIYYLANTLSLNQLRREVSLADREGTVAFNFGDAETVGFWLGFRDAANEAIKWQLSASRRIKPLPGRVDIEGIKAKSDIVAVISGYTKLRKSGKRFMGSCPLHSDKHPSLTVYPDQQSWHCFQCNQGGDVFVFIQTVENVDFRGAAAILGGR